MVPRLAGGLWGRRVSGVGLPTRVHCGAGWQTAAQDAILDGILPSQAQPYAGTVSRLSLG